MQQERFSYLFKQYFNKSSTEKENIEFMELIHSNNFDLQLEELINEYYTNFEYYNNPLSAAQEDKILEAVLQSKPQLPPVKTYRLNSLLKVMAIAASILICLSIGFYFFKQKSYKKEQALAASLLAPGTNKARLVLANGKVILLDTLKNGVQNFEEGIQITKTKDGKLIYNINNQAATNTNQMNSIETPRGGQYQINLPDGTKVWLNAASILKYSNTLTAAKREVFLTGEAYFEVAHREKQPFVVHTTNQLVEVLGTHFNINAYPDEETQVTTLVQGSIKTSSKGHELLLQPGQQSVLHQTNNLFTMSKADIESVMAWKNGDFIFKEEDLASVMRKVARWYDVEVTFQGVNPTAIQLGGWVSREKNIGAVIKIIEPIANVHIKIEGRRLTVMK